MTEKSQRRKVKETGIRETETNVVHEVYRREKYESGQNVNGILLFLCKECVVLSFVVETGTLVSFDCADLKGTNVYLSQWVSS